MIIRDNRYARAKAMLATLMLSFGTPLMVGGDEFSHTNMGNNNHYCQDNAITWMNWEGISERDRNLARICRRIIKLRKKLKIFERRKFLTGKPIDKTGIKDITWYTEAGAEMHNEAWHDGSRKCLAYSIYNGSKYVFCILNANYGEVVWQLPDIDKNYTWNLLLDTSDKFNDENKVSSNQKIHVPSWSVLLFEIRK